MADRLNAIRSQLPADANIVIGPNASSVGWIFQYALVDRERTRDLRELRLLNESTVKPALQSAAGRRRSGVGRRSREAVSGAAVSAAAERARHLAARRCIAAFQGAFQEAGGRTIEVTNREYQLRGASSTENLDKLEYLVRRPRQGRSGRCTCRDVGYLQVGYDLRRGIADLDGEGEVVGGIAIMEQGRNVLAVTRALRAASWRRSAPTLPKGVELVTTYDRSGLIWDTLTNFFQAIGYELIVVILVIALALKNLRAAVGADLRAARSARCSRRCRSRRSTRPSICSPWRDCRLPSARWPTRRS